LLAPPQPGRQKDAFVSLKLTGAQKQRDSITGPVRWEAGRERWFQMRPSHPASASTREFLIELLAVSGNRDKLAI